MSDISDQRSVGSNGSSVRSNGFINGSSFVHKIGATQNNLFSEEESLPSLMDIAKDAPSVTSQRSQRSVGSASFHKWVRTSFSKRGTSSHPNAMYDWVANTEPVQVEDKSNCVVRAFRRSYQIIQANEAMFLIVLAIILARAYPPLGAVYLYPQITSTWIAVMFIFGTSSRKESPDLSTLL